MPLKIDRPLVFLDIEATGVNPAADRIIDLAVIKLRPDGREENGYWRVNPGCPIPPVSTAIHGITDNDVADKPAFRSVAGEVAAVLDGCDIAGFGVIRFDVPLLAAEFARAGLSFITKDRRLVDALAIYHQREPRNLRAAVRFYLKSDFPNAHKAVDDADAARRVLLAQLEHYADLPADVEALDLLCNPRDPNQVDDSGKLVWIGQDAAINFGKYAGKTLRVLVSEDRGYLEWMARKEFSKKVKMLVAEALAGRFPPRSDEERET